MAESPTTLSYQGNAEAADLVPSGTVPIGPLTVTQAGNDLASGQAECQLGTGSQVPSGTTDFGFTDNTYSLTADQIAAGSRMGA